MYMYLFICIKDIQEVLNLMRLVTQGLGRNEIEKNKKVGMEPWGLGESHLPDISFCIFIWL